MNGVRRYVGSTSVVTGAGSGIGQAVAERLASEGAAVALVDLDHEAAREVATTIRKAGGVAESYALDVSDRDAWERTVLSVRSDLGVIELLVNNAGIGSSGGIHEWDNQAFDRVLDVNVKGIIHGTAAVTPGMLERGSGAIVNIASLSGLYGVPGVTAYTASKGAIVSLTRSAAMELAPAVRVNAVAPGKIVTPMRAKMFGADLTAEELAAIAAGYPLRRVGTVQDVAAAVAFLGGEDAAYITGVVLPVEGGLLSGFNKSTV